MNDSRLKGIAVILFGILLVVSSPELNSTIFAKFDDFPRVTIVGMIIGLVGLVIVFKRNND